MNDPNLLAFGCAVAFIAVAGAYVYLRERFEHGLIQAQTEEEAATAQAVQVHRS